MTEMTGRPVSGDVFEIAKRLWKSKLGPVPIPTVTLMIVFILLATPLLAVFRIIPRELFLGPIPQIAPEETALNSPLRPDVGEMVTIPAGEFTMGSEKPGAPQQRTVDLPSFQIDKYETTVAQYRVFAEETGHPEPRGAFSDDTADYPVANVTWEDAQAYCEWAGKRLPTEAEWEKAARGTEGFAYPWGDEWDSELANTRESGIGGVKPVGSFPEGTSPYGVHDMAGNVWEWVEDWATSEQEAKVIRGGSWDAVNRWAQTFSRNVVLPSYTKDNLGFRCAR
jgi:iron(II)-dependent oxidoreductase